MLFMFRTVHYANRFITRVKSFSERFVPRVTLPTTVGKQYTRNMADVVTSLNDRRAYRLVVLENGLRTLLISDLDGADQSSVCDNGDLCDSASEVDESEASGSESDGSDIEMEERTDSEQQGEKKSAAALCIGVGSFCDPDNIPGFAHFLEHMVFMGSEKYPEGNCLDDYVSKHGGGTNAWTDHERTCFYFDVERAHFGRTLDRFAQFFVSPLMLQGSVDREIEAVDSEFQERVPSDDDRINQLLASTAKPGNPMGKFLLGNVETLKHTPTRNGIDVYGRLRDFFNRNYSAQYMTLAVHSKHTLDTLETWVKDSFSGVHNNKEDQPSFQECKAPFDTVAFKKFYKVIPVENTHKLVITWAFPPLHDKYRVKPLEYLSTLMTHEGEGSIYSYLKKKTWALEILGGNSGDGFDDNATWSGCDISITLTDLGLKHVDDVLLTVFEYIALLQDEGPREWRYEEIQTIEQTRFRWKEQGDPTTYVERVCDNMQRYPPHDYLTGHKLWFQYDEKVLEGCIDHLRPDNCNIMLVSSSFTEAECGQTEPWYGTHYSAAPIDPTQLQAWKDVKENPGLFLPRKNKFIATDFELKSCEKSTPLPKLVISTPKCKLHYKKDTKFNVPKGFVYLHLKSPVVSQSVESAALFDLFISVLNHNMAETTYPAVLAGYEIGCSADYLPQGAVIEVNGFNHKLQAVLDVVIGLIVNFSCTDDLFTAVRDQLKKWYHNEVIKPYEAARMLRFMIIEKTYWSHQERLGVMDSVTKQELYDLVQSFLAEIFVEILVVGNFTQQEAVAVCDSMMSRLDSMAVPQDMLHTNNVMELPVEKTLCQVRGFNPEDANSCIINYYQNGPGNLRKSCLNDVLMTRMQEPCFNTLRTKLQLGYSVFSMNFQTLGILGIGIIIECQAPKFSMQYVDEQIENFLIEMKQILDSMTEDEFHSLVESVVTVKRVEDTHLGEEVAHHWVEIQTGTYLFDRKHREIDILKTLTLEDLRNWFSEYLGDRQHKLSVQVVGKKTSSVLPADSDHTELPANSDHIKCLQDPEQKHSVAITNIADFKSSLKHLPLTKIIS